MTASSIVGWNSDITPWQREVAAKRIPHGGTYLEVGVFLGASLANMGEMRPDIQLIAIDPWLDEPKVPPGERGWEGNGIFAEDCARHGGLWLAFLHNMMTHAPDVLRRTRIIRGTARTVDLHGVVDCTFIDGAHDQQSVREDLLMFGTLVRPGGIVAGHDYHPDFPGVVQAVHDRFRHHEMGVPGSTEQSTVWWVNV